MTVAEPKPNTTDALLAHLLNRLGISGMNGASEIGVSGTHWVSQTGVSGTHGVTNIIQQTQQASIPQAGPTAYYTSPIGPLTNVSPLPGLGFERILQPGPFQYIRSTTWVGIKELRAIPSTIHTMMKFPTPGGVATLVTRSIIISECRKLEEKFLLRKETEAEVPPAAAMISEDEKTEKIMVHPAYPDQLVTIGKNFSPEGRKLLINLLKNNKDVFAWKPSDMTGSPIIGYGVLSLMGDTAYPSSWIWRISLSRNGYGVLVLR
ncbi:reverse transcriptase domain-containing protein [Artemisia annua]|uniref:Reverse transcriptase domain-containing protein n=1 Tax=Artemisia annua TaxID=35608 RepID=A0A2U1LDK9_ARTAN|nr:reverse transcriptase domain-containing protein [Artemisia annua]